MSGSGAGGNCRTRPLVHGLPRFSLVKISLISRIGAYEQTFCCGHCCVCEAIILTVAITATAEIKVAIENSHP